MEIREMAEKVARFAYRLGDDSDYTDPGANFTLYEACIELNVPSGSVEDLDVLLLAMARVGILARRELNERVPNPSYVAIAKRPEFRTPVVAAVALADLSRVYGGGTIGINLLAGRARDYADSDAEAFELVATLLRCSTLAGSIDSGFRVMPL